MKLVIISGYSGSGKSTALHILEDVGYYCIDNLPAGLLSALATELKFNPNPVERVAVGIDARNLPKDLAQFEYIIDDLKKQSIHCEILFLSSDTNILIKRFKETRRRHPLSNDALSLAEAIEHEHQLLEPVASRADLYIDTSQTNVHELRGLVHERVERCINNSLSLQFMSFGYKHGIPTDADFVFDVRCLPNPHWQPELRPLTGKDSAVANYLEQQEPVQKMYRQLRSFLGNWIPEFMTEDRCYLSIAVGCTGGQHRSVYLIERLTRHFTKTLPNTSIRHRELP